MGSIDPTVGGFPGIVFLILIFKVLFFSELLGEVSGRLCVALSYF
jgi:hypothetical protein